MGKGKPRHDSNKPQNRYSADCWWAEEINSQLHCTRPDSGESRFVLPICKGNPHNCIKTKYHRLASRSDKQKQM